MKIAVLMSTYNGEKYLRTQIDSILRQKGDFELRLIVRDDGSSDSTVPILKEYESAGLLTWYTGENLRAGKSFLDLIVKTEGYDYYAFSDQDDEWLEHKLSTELDALRGHTAPSIVFSNAEIVDEELKPLGRNAYRNPPPVNFESVLVASCVQGCTMVFNEALARLIREKEIPSFPLIHDAYLSKVCLAVGGELLYVDVPLIRYRQHDSNVIGFPKTKLQALKNRLNIILQKNPVLIDTPAKELLRMYGDALAPDTVPFLQMVATYPERFSSRWSLVFSRKIRHVSANMLICKKLSLILKHL